MVSIRKHCPPVALLVLKFFIIRGTLLTRDWLVRWHEITACSKSSVTPCLSLKKHLLFNKPIVQLPPNKKDAVVYGGLLIRPHAFKLFILWMLGLAVLLCKAWGDACSQDGEVK